MRWLSLLILLFSRPAIAQSGPSCASPHHAAWTHLYYLQADSYDREAAGTCFGLDDPATASKLAVQLKDVLDARGLYVPVDQLSKDPDHGVDEGNARVVLHPDLPQVALEKHGERWVYSQATVTAIPALHSSTFSPGVRHLREALPPVFGTQLVGIALWQALFFVILLGVGWLAGRLVNWLLRGQLRTWVQALGLAVNQTVFERTRRPMRWLVMGLVVWWRVPDLQLSVQASGAVLFAARTAVSVAAVLIALRWIDVFAGVFRDRAGGTETRMDDQLIPLVSRALKLAAVLLGVVWVLENMGVDVGSLVAGLGIGGLAVALAAKDTLANVFGSLTIFGDRPFQIGDWVLLGDGTEGVIEEVGFRSTRIRTFHNSVVTVPNSVVANGRVDNMGQRQYRRFKTTLQITYDTPPAVIAAFVEGVRAVLRAQPRIRQDGFEVHLRDFGASSLDILVYSFFDVPDWHEELVGRSEVILAILRLAEDLGVSFAFPSSSVYLESTPDHPLQSRGVPADLAAQVEAYRAVEPAKA